MVLLITFKPFKQTNTLYLQVTIILDLVQLLVAAQTVDKAAEKEVNS